MPRRPGNAVDHTGLDAEQAYGAGWTKPVQVGALVAVVIVSVILLGLVSSHGKRLAAVERGTKANRNEVSRLADQLGDRPEPATEAELAELRKSVGKLRAATERLDRKVTALALEGKDEGLSRSVGDLTKIVRELSDGLAEVRRMAEKPAEAAGGTQAHAGVPAKNLAALSDRVARLERSAAEIERLAGEGSRGSSKDVRIDAKKLEAFVEDRVKKIVDEQIKEALRELMRQRIMGPRRPR